MKGIGTPEGWFTFFACVITGGLIFMTLFLLWLEVAW